MGRMDYNLVSNKIPLNLNVLSDICEEVVILTLP